MDTRRLAEKNLLFKARSGSHAYGMATPESDMDIRGVFAAGRLNVVTQFFRVEQVESKVPDDLVLWELSRYVKLVCDQNPIIVELLWVDPADILFEDPAWSMLRDMRGELLTRKLRHTYGGYAKQQLDRMKAHSKWINNPQPEEPPRPADFVTMVHNVCLPRDFNKRVPADGAWTAAECGNDTYLLFPGGSGTWFDGTGNIRSFSQHDAALQTSEPLAAIVKFNRADYEGLTTATASVIIPDHLDRM
jgi:hypothetical protein